MRTPATRNRTVGVRQFTSQYTDMAMGTNACTFLVSVRCMTLILGESGGGEGEGEGNF